MDLFEFLEHIKSMPKWYQNRDMKEYLLALYNLLIENKEKEVTCDLIIDILEDAFNSPSVEFNEKWLECISAPDENLISFDAELISSNQAYITPFQFTIEVIKFQSAELHKMKGNQLEYEYKYFGVQSETGHDWYNFDPFGNLECGVSCMIDHKMKFDTLDWSFIGILLECGRIYE